MISILDFQSLRQQNHLIRCKKEAQAKQSGELISKEINSALDDVNAKYAEIERLKRKFQKRKIR